MGNCQAVDAAVLEIQHPGGIERMYWPVTASEVMKMNPGHYVSLIIPLPISSEEKSDEKTAHFPRVKLLRPTDTLVLGRAYRLITTQDVIKVLKAKRYAKMKENQPRSGEQLPVVLDNQCSSQEPETREPASEKNDQAMINELHRTAQILASISTKHFGVVTFYSLRGFSAWNRDIVKRQKIMDILQHSQLLVSNLMCAELQLITPLYGKK